MKSSRIVEYSAIFLIVFLFTGGCIFPKQQQDPNNNSTPLVTPSVPIMTLSEKNVGNNDTNWIMIDPIVGYNTYYNGFNITAQTNLPIDENILIIIYNATPRAKGSNGFSITGYTNVTNRDRNSNKISFRVNPQFLSAGYYTILISAGENGPSNSTNFWIVPSP